MTWEYSYRLNDEGAERKSKGPNPTFSSVWHTENKDPETKHTRQDTH